MRPPLRSKTRSTIAGTLSMKLYKTLAMINERWSDHYNTTQHCWVSDHLKPLCTLRMMGDVAVPRLQWPLGPPAWLVMLWRAGTTGVVVGWLVRSTATWFATRSATWFATWLATATTEGGNGSLLIIRASSGILLSTLIGGLRRCDHRCDRKLGPRELRQLSLFQSFLQFPSCADLLLLHHPAFQKSFLQFPSLP